MKTITTTYIIVKIADKDLKEGIYNHNGYTYMKYGSMMKWSKTNPYPGYHIPTIEEMKDAFKGKSVAELQKEIGFEFSGYRSTGGGFSPAGYEENFWSCSPTSDEDDAHYCYLKRDSDSPNFDNGFREYGCGVLLFKDKSSDSLTLGLFQEIIQKLQDKKILNEQENKKIQETILFLNNLTT